MREDRDPPAGAAPTFGDRPALGAGAGPPEVRTPRMLTIMGSGETAPTMVKVHRRVAGRLLASGTTTGVPTRPQVGPRPQPELRTETDLHSIHGLLLDTPFGFQKNAGEIAARAENYFRESVGATLEVAGLRSAADLAGGRGDEILARMVSLPLIFAGPGSPSYALRQWKGTLVPSLLAEKLTLGGAVTFASAAALTLGSLTIPVYEVYKVGEEPHWLEGLDLLGPMGLPAVMIPHYDNAEGQTHDTRYCYLGEERLLLMEGELDDRTFVLGVDEHTALCMDFEAGSATVMGIGGVTVRVHGRSARIETGDTVALERILELASELSSNAGVPSSVTQMDDLDSVGGSTSGNEEGASPNAGNEQGGEGRSRAQGSYEEQRTSARPTSTPLLNAIRAHESRFGEARETGNAPGMVSAVLALGEELWAWRADTLQSDEMDRGRASLRAMIGELGHLSEVGVRDLAETIGPYVDIAVAIRDSARSERRFAEADSVRERLEILGIDVHDNPKGSTWEIRHGDSTSN